MIFFDPYTKRSYTYIQTKTAARDFGKGLKAIYDWRKNDVLALFTPNSIDTGVIMWGTLWAGGIVTPANHGYNADPEGTPSKRGNPLVDVLDVC